jgi:hypothetical protein
MNRYFSVCSLLLVLFIYGCKTTQPATTAEEVSAAEVSLQSQPDSTFQLTFADLQVEVAPQKGGRIISLKMGGKELLANVDTLSFGSTFWPSPQSAWGWPPPYLLDAAPYIATASGDTLKMVSRRDEKLGWQFEKEVSLSPWDTAVAMTYTIRNFSDTVQHVAPWQNSRVVKSGLVFFPVGKQPLTQGKHFKNIPTQETDGIVWISLQRDMLSEGEKLVTDGAEGWLAYVYDGLLLVKQFEDIAPQRQAPGEGDVEIYVGKPHLNFTEIEPQGAYQALQPGEELTWKVRWYVRKLKEQQKIEAGNPALVQQVRRLVME